MLIFLKKISMKKIEQLFKKVNKESIVINKHKDGLRNYLLSNDYFNKEKTKFSDFRLAAVSLAFSIFIISITFFFASNEPKEIALENNFKKEPETMLKTFNFVNESAIKDLENDEEILFNKLIKKDNVIINQKKWQEQEVIVLELLEGNLKTIYYFNKDKNLLLGSEAYEVLPNNNN